MGCLAIARMVTVRAFRKAMTVLRHVARWPTIALIARVGTDASPAPSSAVEGECDVRTRQRIA
eukprot:9204149-Pyramimonas_sp.AAC.1